MFPGSSGWLRPTTVVLSGTRRDFPRQDCDPSPHKRRIYATCASTTRASRSLARSPCLAPPRIRFWSIGSRCMLHVASPRPVTLTQLRFTSFAAVNSREDFYPQDRAHAGRTKEKHPGRDAFPGDYVTRWPCWSRAGLAAPCADAPLPVALVHPVRGSSGLTSCYRQGSRSGGRRDRTCAHGCESNQSR